VECAESSSSRANKPTPEYARPIRIALPLIAAFACFYLASRLTVPLAGFALFIIALGLVFDAGTALFARVGGTGGMSDHRQ
jgi:hypothetical protein